MIYFDDFERTEYSDSIQAVIGRALIVGTRFENLCKHAHKTIIISSTQINRVIDKSDSDDPDKIDEIYIKSFTKAFDRFIKLIDSINELQKEINLPDKLKKVLIAAKNARNKLVHSATIGMEGCIEIKGSESTENLLSEIKKLINIIAEGDYLISSIITQMNKEDILQPQHAQSYKANILNWVVEL